MERPSGDAGSRRRGLPRLARAGVGLLALAALVLVWRLTPLADFVDLARVRAVLEHFAGAYEPAAVVAIFVAAGLLGFPVTILIVATAMVCGPWLGLGYAAVGVGAGAAAGYGVGAVFGQNLLSGMLGSRLARIRRVIDRRGVLAIATIRLLPLAPFAVVNLLAGASRVRFADFMVGSLLGLAPHLIALSMLGDQIFTVLREPTPGGIATAAALLAGWLMLVFAIQTVLSRRRAVAEI